jgi:hypothetical protein
MKLASYKATRPGFQGLFNRLIRWRFDGAYSHTEIVFEPGDGVAHHMPDGTCQPDADGALWCASSVALERLPRWSKYRAGCIGGVRLKRVVLDPAKWDVQTVRADPAYAIAVYQKNEGHPYSWRLVAKFVAWAVALRGTTQKYCSQICADMLGFEEGWRFDPCALAVVAGRCK